MAERETDIYKNRDRKIGRWREREDNAIQYYTVRYYTNYTVLFYRILYYNMPRGGFIAKGGLAYVGSRNPDYNKEHR